MENRFFTSMKRQKEIKYTSKTYLYHTISTIPPQILLEQDKQSTTEGNLIYLREMLESTGGRNWNLPNQDKQSTKSNLPEEDIESTRARNCNLPVKDVWGISAEKGTLV